MESKKHGKGIYYSKAQDLQMEGEWKSDVRDGFFVETSYRDGERKEGNYVEGERHGSFSVFNSKNN